MDSKLRCVFEFVDSGEQMSNVSETTSGSPLMSSATSQLKSEDSAFNSEMNSAQSQNTVVKSICQTLDYHNNLLIKLFITITE